MSRSKRALFADRPHLNQNCESPPGINQRFSPILQTIPKDDVKHHQRIAVSKFRKLQHLSSKEWCLLAQAQTLLPLTFVGVYVLGVVRWQNVLAKLAKLGNIRNGSDREEDTAKRTGEIALMVNAAADHGVFRAHCLQRSLVLWCLLERNGIGSEIRYGARKENGQVQAHAWVELKGVALQDDEHRHFSRFEELTGTNWTA